MGDKGKVYGIEHVPEVRRRWHAPLHHRSHLYVSLSAAKLRLKVRRVPPWRPQLNAMSIASTKKHHADLLTSGRLDLSVVDGFDGLPSAAPFDAIHVGAAAPHIPKALLQQV